MKRVIWGVVFIVFTLAVLIINYSDLQNAFILPFILGAGILMIISGRKFLALRNHVIAESRDMLMKTEKIDVPAISRTLNKPEMDIRIIISEAQSKNILPMDAEIVYTGKGDTQCYIPYAIYEGKGWEIIFTSDKVHFLMIFRKPVLYVIFEVITFPLLLIPYIGDLLEIAQSSIFIGLLKKKTKTVQSLGLEEKLKINTQHLIFRTDEIKSVNIGRKNVKFLISGKSYNFHLCKKLKTVCPRHRPFFENSHIEIIS
ncbi:hypothetical protein JW948_01535 [bacterium]|nr:hypothetical protein [bacterium]